MQKQDRDTEVYRAYILAKADPKKTVVSVARELGITRNVLYEIVRRVEHGNTAKIRKCTEKSRLDCLWEYKYKARFLAIPKDRKEGSVLALRALIKEMHTDDFGVSDIAARIGKDRSTIIHHLEN